MLERIKKFSIKRFIYRRLAKILQPTVKGYCMGQDMDYGWIYGDDWYIEFGRR